MRDADAVSIEFRDPRECHYGKCSNRGTVHVGAVLPFGNEGGNSALACTEHVGPMAVLLVESLRKTYEGIVKDLT